MKKIALTITAILFCILALFGCNTDINKQATDTSSSDVKSSIADSSAKSENISMTFAKLPSPPKCKKQKIKKRFIK